MSNHIINKLTFNGDKEKIDQFIQEIKNSDKGIKIFNVTEYKNTIMFETNYIVPDGMIYELSKEYKNVKIDLIWNSENNDIGEAKYNQGIFNKCKSYSMKSKRGIEIDNELNMYKYEKPFIDKENYITFKDDIGWKLGTEIFNQYASKMDEDEFVENFILEYEMAIEHEAKEKGIEIEL